MPRGRAYELAPGTRLGRYRVVQRLGSGGMAELYLARAKGAEGFSKLVAIKRILPHLSDDRTLVDMFFNEARLAATLDHPNVAQVLDFDEFDTEHYMAMEYVHGPSVREILRRAANTGGELPLACALSIVVGAAAGLHHAHERSDERGRPLAIVHRDVSPSNVLVTTEGNVKLIDFGIARAAARTSVTHGKAIKGKVGYMAPEQCLGQAVDRRTDVFALGIMLWELTVLERLFVAESDLAVMNLVANGQITPPSDRRPDYPPALEQIVLQALAPEPEDRYPTALALMETVEDYAQAEGIRLSPTVLAQYVRTHFPDLPEVTDSTVGLTQTSYPDTSETHDDPTRRFEPPRRGATWPWVAAALVLGTIAGLGIGTWTPSSSPEAEELARPAAVVPDALSVDGPESNDGSAVVPATAVVERVPAPPETSSPTAAPSTSDDPGSTPTEPAPTRQRPNASGKRGRRAKKRGSGKRDAHYDPTSLFPPGKG